MVLCFYVSVLSVSVFLDCKLWHSKWLVVKKIVDRIFFIEELQFNLLPICKISRMCFYDGLFHHAHKWLIVLDRK